MMYKLFALLALVAVATAASNATTGSACTGLLKRTEYDTCQDTAKDACAKPCVWKSSPQGGSQRQAPFENGECKIVEDDKEKKRAAATKIDGDVIEFEKKFKPIKDSCKTDPKYAVTNTDAVCEAKGAHCRSEASYAESPVGGKFKSKCDLDPAAIVSKLKCDKKVLAKMMAWAAKGAKFKANQIKAHAAKVKKVVADKRAKLTAVKAKKAKCSGDPKAYGPILNTTIKCKQYTDEESKLASDIALAEKVETAYSTAEKDTAKISTKATDDSTKADTDAKIPAAASALVPTLTLALLGVVAAAFAV